MSGMLYSVSLSPEEFQIILTECLARVGGGSVVCRNVAVSACGVSEDLILRYVNTHVNIAGKQCRDDAARLGGLLNEKERMYSIEK